MHSLNPAACPAAAPSSAMHSKGGLGTAPFLSHPVALSSAPGVSQSLPSEGASPPSLALLSFCRAQAGCATSAVREVPGELQALRLGPAQAAGAGEQAPASFTPSSASPCPAAQATGPMWMAQAGNVPLAGLGLQA